jgi:hypothetical protein
MITMDKREMMEWWSVAQKLYMRSGKKDEPRQFFFYEWMLAMEFD